MAGRLRLLGLVVRGREIGRAARAIGVGLLMATSAIVALYLSGYVRPPYHPSAPSFAAAASTTLECLSVVIYPNGGPYWMAAGLLVAFFSVVTLVRLAIVGVRTPAERPQAFGLSRDHPGDARHGCRRGRIADPGLGPGASAWPIAISPS